jgi:galactose mutarotase-like enzyme
MHQLENNFLRVIAREHGAELTSLVDKKNNIEHLWQADPHVWGWHAPVLFPVVGRNLNDEIDIDGQKYRLEKHGFARKANFRLMDLTETSIVFSLKNNEQLQKIYPYKFEFLVRYKLEENAVVVSYEVVNKDNKDIYFQIGGHPAFTVPFAEEGNYEDYYLEFEEKEKVARYYIDKSGYFDGRKDIAIANSNILDLKAGMFKDDAFIFKNLKSRRVTLKSKTGEHYVTVDFKEFKYLGIWAKVGAPFVCIEPWLGCADTVDKPTEFKDKEGVIKLEKDGTFRVSFRIEVG